MTDIERLVQLLEEHHRVTAEHVESVPVHETWDGKTIWQGVVEVFRVTGHPETTRAYGWAHETDDPSDPRRFVTVLHVPPAITPLMAVRASIAKDYYDRA